MLKTEQRRGARSFGSHQKLVDPLETQRMLLQYHEAANYGLDFAGSNGLFRKGVFRDFSLKVCLGIDHKKCV